MPRAQIKLEDLKPFGRAIVEFLYDQRPSWPVLKLAEKAELSSQALWDWIYGRSRPSLERLKRLYQVMHEYSYKIADQDITLEMLCDLAGISSGSTNPWRGIETYISAELRIPTEAREKLIQTLHEAENEFRSQTA
jgi:transcriptional regulator with XRE-family HTH domain